VRGPPVGLAELSGADLRAVAELWKRGGREIVARFGGTSMLPTIRPGAEVLLQCGDEVRVGDVIVFIADDRPIVHRVVAISGRGSVVLTCGDAHVVPDQPITDRGRLVGRVVGVRRNGGFVPVASPPDRVARRVCVTATTALLRLGPGPAERLIAAIRFARRWGVHLPWVLGARAKGWLVGAARRRCDPSRGTPEDPESSGTRGSGS
jgi:signal peptidase I